MKITLPFNIGDRIMLKYNRTQGSITSIEGTLLADGTIERLRFGINDYSCSNNLEDIKKKFVSNDITKILDNKYNIGKDVLYHNDNPYKNFILKRGKIDKIKFTIGVGWTSYSYVIGNSGSMLGYTIYKNREDFISRTQPKKEIKYGERYIFRNYMVQQKRLEVIKVDEHSTIHSTYRGEKIRNCFLYTSKEKFYNRMLAQV